IDFLKDASAILLGGILISTFWDSYTTPIIPLLSKAIFPEICIFIKKKHAYLVLFNISFLHYYPLCPRLRWGTLSIHRFPAIRFCTEYKVWSQCYCKLSHTSGFAIRYLY